MTRLPSYEADHSAVRLGQLRRHLNERYGTDVANWFDADQRAALIVARGQQISDVVVAVSVNDDDLFRIEVYTSQAWATYDDPFVCAERDAVQRAAAYALQFVPETPCT